MEYTSLSNSKSTLNFRLDQFDGPLDLLIELIKEHKLDILTVNIAELTYQYLSFVNENLIRLPIDEISEYLVMASYLTELKTKSLLNSFNTYDEYIDNEIEIDRLRRQLFLYKQYKDVINEFRIRQTDRARYVAKKCDNLDDYAPEDIPEAPLPTSIDINKIIKAWQRIVIQNRNKQEFKPFIIKVNNIDVDKMEQNLIDFVQTQSKFDEVPLEDFIHSFFNHKIDIENYCAIFMCLLVLAKNGFIKLFQTEHCGKILVSKNNEEITYEINQEIFDTLKLNESISFNANQELNNKTNINQKIDEFNKKKEG